MRVLVTGATGFVGSHTAVALIERGYQVRLLVRDPAKAQRIFCARGVRVADVVLGDVTDQRSVDAALPGCDGVVHTAGVTPMNAGAGLDIQGINVGGTQIVVGAACEGGIASILYVSSITAIFRPDPARITAHARVVPSTHAYGRSKVDAEVYVRNLQQAGYPVTIVYPGGILGPDDPGLSAASSALRYRLTEKFLLTSGGAQHVDVRDLAAAIVTLIR